MAEWSSAIVERFAKAIQVLNVWSRVRPGRVRVRVGSRNDFGGSRVGFSPTRKGPETRPIPIGLSGFASTPKDWIFEEKKRIFLVIFHFFLQNFYDKC